MKKTGNLNFYLTMCNDIKISVVTSLYRCINYISDYLIHVDNIVNKEECEILLLLNDPTPEELAIIIPQLAQKPWLKLIRIDERESLYATWNRGCRMAKGKYIAIWNVDDVRLPDSLLEQAIALDASPRSMMSYGNYIMVDKYGDTTGRYIKEKDYRESPHVFLHSHIVGCFPMWRKSVHNAMGYFDEQFRLVSDYEFQVRVAHSYSLVNTHTTLGYYLQGGGTEGRLSQNVRCQNRERTAVELRYGIYFKINLLYIFSAQSYSINEVIDGEECISIDRYVSISFLKKLFQIPQLIIAVFHLPLNIVRFFRFRRHNFCFK